MPADGLPAACPSHLTPPHAVQMASLLRANQQILQLLHASMQQAAELQGQVTHLADKLQQRPPLEPPPEAPPSPTSTGSSPSAPPPLLSMPRGARTALTAPMREPGKGAGSGIREEGGLDGTQRLGMLTPVGVHARGSGTQQQRQHQDPQLQRQQDPQQQQDPTEAVAGCGQAGQSPSTLSAKGVGEGGGQAKGRQVRTLNPGFPSGQAHLDLDLDLDLNEVPLTELEMERLARVQSKRSVFAGEAVAGLGEAVAGLGEAVAGLGEAVAEAVPGSEPLPGADEDEWAGARGGRWGGGARCSEGQQG